MKPKGHGENSTEGAARLSMLLPNRTRRHLPRWRRRPPSIQSRLGDNASCSLPDSLPAPHAGRAVSGSAIYRHTRHTPLLIGKGRKPARTLSAQRAWIGGGPSSRAGVIHDWAGRWRDSRLGSGPCAKSTPAGRRSRSPVGGGARDSSEGGTLLGEPTVDPGTMPELAESNFGLHGAFSLCRRRKVARPTEGSFNSASTRFRNSCGG